MREYKDLESASTISQNKFGGELVISQRKSFWSELILAQSDRNIFV